MDGKNIYKKHEIVHVISAKRTVKSLRTDVIVQLLLAKKTTVKSLHKDEIVF